MKYSSDNLDKVGNAHLVFDYKPDITVSKVGWVAAATKILGLSTAAEVSVAADTSIASSGRSSIKH